MPTLTVCTPNLPCFVERLYLRNQEDGAGEFEKAYVFAATSRPNHALEFWVMTERGGVFQSVPITALRWEKPEKPTERVDVEQRQWWNSPSYDIVCYQLPFLRKRTGGVRLRDIDEHTDEYEGEYICTFEWYNEQNQRPDTTFSEEPAEKKSQHLFSIHTGEFALAPNDKVRWNPDSWMDGYDTPPDYKRNTRSWTCE